MIEGKAPGDAKPVAVGRDTIRSRLVLEIAAEMVDHADWPNRQARVSLRPQGADHWSVNMIASDGPAAIDLVASGELHLAISNPAMYLALAVRGTGPYKQPIPLRAITIIPSPDQLAFAVTEKIGLRSLRTIGERRFPLRLSMRGQRDHALHPIVDQVFAAAGFSLDDIVSWGGHVRYDDGLPMKSNRFGAMQRGEVDLIVDEAVRGWPWLLSPGVLLELRFSYASVWLWGELVALAAAVPVVPAKSTPLRSNVPPAVRQDNLHRARVYRRSGESLHRALAWLWLSALSPWFLSPYGSGRSSPVRRPT